MRIAATQFPLRDTHGENLEYIVQTLDSCKRIDIAIFPGMCLTGFSTAPHEQIQEKITAVQEAAKKKNVWVVAGGVVQRGEHRFNEVYVISPSGLAHTHQKAGLSPYERDITPGNGNHIPVQTPYGKIGVLECAELLNDQRAGLLAKRGAHTIIYIATWIYQPSLYREGEWDRYLSIPEKTATTHNVHVVVCDSINKRTTTDEQGNTVQRETVGRSCVIRNDGQELVRAQRRPETIYATLQEAPYIKTRQVLQHTWS